MDLIEGMEKTCDAHIYHDLLHRYRSNLHEFFPRVNEWHRWLQIHIDDACHTPYFAIQLIGLYVREVWLQLDAEDLVASEHYRPGIIEEVTAETVMVVPLYLLGIFKSWAEQMEWNDLPSRVMD
eukprot:6188412-Amphidinium_carterae.1